MLNFSVARHYCRGELVASRISLSGTLATCGMEAGNEDCPYGQRGDLIESHCCDDVIASYSIDNNYTPASQATDGFTRTKIQVPATPVESTVTLSVILHQNWSDISPPRQLMTSAVDLPFIGAFRI